MTEVATTVFAVCGTVTNVLFNVPQLVRTYKTKNVVALSKKTIVLRIVCSACWACYSALKHEWLFFATCVINVFSEVLLFVAKIRFTVKKENAVVLTVKL